LNKNPSTCCFDAHGSAEEALKSIPSRKPDVVLVDINLPGLNGIKCVAGLKAKLPDLSVLMLTRYEDSEMIFAALRAGASGYLLKKTILTELISAIEQVRMGGTPLSMQVAREVVGYFNRNTANSNVENLGKREQEVLSLIAKGYINKEIAEILGVSLETVRTHLKRIYEKLHVHSRTEAAAEYFGQSDHK
jgi:DNA-binding NarL/FixJ family response regulator